MRKIRVEPVFSHTIQVNVSLTKRCCIVFCFIHMSIRVFYLHAVAIPNCVFFLCRLKINHMMCVYYWTWRGHEQLYCNVPLYAQLNDTNQFKGKFNRNLFARYTIDEFPSLVYFEQEIPSVFDGDLENGREVMAWVVDLLTGADIEEVIITLHSLSPYPLFPPFLHISLSIFLSFLSIFCVSIYLFVYITPISRISFYLSILIRKV